MTKHVQQITKNTIHQLHLREEFLCNSIDEIEEYWEEYGGLDYSAKKGKDDSLALTTHNTELYEIKKLIKFLSK